MEHGKLSRRLWGYWGDSYARAQLRRCVVEVDEEKLRSLSAESLYHLEVLSKIAGLAIAAPPLRGLALDLLPPKFRDQLEQH